MNQKDVIIDIPMATRIAAVNTNSIHSIGLTSRNFIHNSTPVIQSIQQGTYHWADQVQLVLAS